ncbi:MAG: transcription termination/antitermination protein NusG [Planctomycetota bacterium]
MGEAKAAPMAVAANGADPPAEPEVPQAQPLSEPPDAPAEEAKTPEEPQTGEAAPPPAEEAERAETPVEEAETPVEEGEGEEKPGEMDWYILKVQSNREDSIRDGLLRRVAIAGLDRHFGQVIVPVEQVTEFKGGKKRVTKRKLYPGYLVVQMEINDDTWFLVRETPGIGDFTGAAGHPTPMLAHEVNRILARQDDKTDETPKLKIAFNTGDQVKINEGTFENFEGEVHTIDQTSGRVTVMINIFGRSTPVELEYWQIESI